MEIRDGDQAIEPAYDIGELRCPRCGLHAAPGDIIKAPRPGWWGASGKARCGNRQCGVVYPVTMQRADGAPIWSTFMRPRKG